MILYPTGNNEGVWVEVADEVGNKGWVSRLSIANYRVARSGSPKANEMIRLDHFER